MKKLTPEVVVLFLTVGFSITACQSNIDRQLKQPEVEAKTDNVISKPDKVLDEESAPIKKVASPAPINEVASPSQLQDDRENACNAQLKEMTINAYVCATSAKTFTTDLEMSDWMSGIKITYPLRFDKSGNRLPEDDAYLNRVKAFYNAHGQDINDESTYHPSKIIPSPIYHSKKSP
jgi:hypothetical protein